jgi:AcrR family transcriptional regulator
MNERVKARRRQAGQRETRQATSADSAQAKPAKPAKPAPSVSAAPRPKRGRPVNEAAKRAVLEAARELLADGGPGAVTMEAVAGVSKPTLYRHWPDRHALAMAALMEDDSVAAPRANAASALGALRAQLRAIAARFRSTTGRHVASMIAAADGDSELGKAFRNHFVLARRAEGRALLDRAIRAGAVRANIDVDVALDLLYGPLFFRLLLGHAELDEGFMERVLDEALRGLAPAGKPARA